MRFYIVLAVIVSLFNISQCFVSTGNAAFDNGNFVANWTYNSDTDKIKFQVEVKKAGWVGFGFATKAPNAMKDYDVVVATDSAGSPQTLVVSKSRRISSVFELEMFVYLYLSVRETLFTSSENKTAPIINKELNEETR